MVIKPWFGNRKSNVKASETESGQSIIILVFAFLGLVAMLGLALDLGLLYVERIRMKRAIDAAVLAGVVELPDEEQAMARAIEYLNLNGYDVDTDTAIQVVGCTRDGPTALLSTLANRATPYDYISFAAPKEDGGRVGRYQVKCSDKPIVAYQDFLDHKQTMLLTQN